MEDKNPDLQICQTAHQLWTRGFMVATSGLISIETHRRRFLVTPTDLRRSDLTPQQLVTVDVGGVSVDGTITLDPTLWLPHRLAYQRRSNPHGSNPLEGVTRATLLADPPMTAALLRSRPDSQVMELPACPPIAVAALEETSLKEAVDEHQFIAIRGAGLLCMAVDLSEALNGLETVEHAATIQMTCDRRG